MNMTCCHTKVQQTTGYSGGYHLVCSLGRGGTARVLLGVHPRTGKKVALKVPLSAEPATLRAFQNEARYLGQLSHPHIIKGRSSISQNGDPFLVMQYAAYGSLRQYYRCGCVALPLSVALQLGWQAANALEYLHTRGIIHCDVKPENLLLLRPDHVLLADFGIARQEREGTGRRGPIGTIRYMAPEQFAGEAYYASDQYALAVLLYECLCGEAPFIGSSEEVMRQHLAAPPPHLRGPGALLPYSVDRVLRRALSKNPADRFASVDAFMRALEQGNRGCYAVKMPLLEVEEPYSQHQTLEMNPSPHSNKQKVYPKLRRSGAWSKPRLRDLGIFSVCQLVLLALMSQYHPWFLLASSLAIFCCLRFLARKYVWGVLVMVDMFALLVVYVMHSELAVNLHAFLALLLTFYLTVNVRYIRAKRSARGTQ